jgi:hypothetical protein
LKFLIVTFLRLFGLPGHFLEFLLSMRKIGFPSGEGIPRVLVSFNLINIFRGFFTRFIVSSNLDWIWPFWIRRQFYADNPDFVARGFQPSSINTTYRNWTGIGNLNSKLESVVDPRGLLSPWIEKWSVPRFNPNSSNSPTLRKTIFPLSAASCSRVRLSSCRKGSSFEKSSESL